MPANSDPSIYLDHNASTPLDPAAAEAMLECYRQIIANPSSQHALGRLARRKLDDARDAIAHLLGGSKNDQLVLTSGGTESNNLALRGLLGEPPGKIVLSAVEHPSLTQLAPLLEKLGWEIEWIQVDGQGLVDLDQIRRAVIDRCHLVSIQFASSETGVIQPIREIGAICREQSVPLHCDAAQGVGKIDCPFRDLGVAALSFAGHKFHGPVGIGGLLLDANKTLKPLLRGGAQQLELRPGTESVALAVGLQVALARWRDESESRFDQMQLLRDRFEQLLSEALPDLTIHGSDTPRLPNTSNIAFGRLDRQTLFMRLDMVGIGCSTGTACSSGSSEPSPVLLAMGLPLSVVESSLRFSLGSSTRQAEIDEAAERIIDIVKELRRGPGHRSGR